MKSKIFAITFLAANLMFSACDNNQKNNGKSVESANPEYKVTATQSEESAAEEKTPDSSDDPTGIISIRKTWAGQTIKVDAGKSTVGIEQFAKAFCKTYPQCETNKAMLDYLNSPKDYKSDLFEIDSKPRNGYIRCMMEVQTAPLTDVCYWNRKNGHKLFAAYMESTHESMAWDEHQVVFYDYDPATNIMTPEPALTEMIEKRVKKFDSYSVALPDEGKDIEVNAYTFDEENDSAEGEELKLKWNGMTFDWGK